MKQNKINPFIFIFAVFLAGAAFAQLVKDNATFDDFVMRGQDKQTGEDSWILYGNHAIMRGDEVDIDGVDLHFIMDDKSNVRVLSPQCTFNQFTRVGKSESEIKVVGENMKLTGVGYNLLADRQKLMIKSRVQMWIDGGASQSSTKKDGENEINAIDNQRDKD